MMLALGLFTFSLDTLAYQEFSRRTDWKHSKNARFGARDANQFIGPGVDALSLRGYLMPEFAGDPASLDTLRDMASAGESWALVDGTGRVYGNWVIDGIDEGQSVFFADGMPRKIDFTIDMHQVDP